VRPFTSTLKAFNRFKIIFDATPIQSSSTYVVTQFRNFIANLQLARCLSLSLTRLTFWPGSVRVVLTLDEVSSSMVDRSSTCRAAAIWDRRRSSFRSFCRSPVRCASSTISVPKWLNALTNSVKLLTPSKRPRLWDT